MKKYLLCCALMVAALGLTTSARAQETALPAENLPDGWEQTGELRQFKGAALYRHINGGSELYLEKGFEILYVQDFMHASGEEIRLEIYDMGTPEGAVAIMDANTRGLETSSQYGGKASVDPYQILFIRDTYYVSVTCYSDGEIVSEGMDAISRATDSHLKSLK